MITDMSDQRISNVYFFFLHRLLDLKTDSDTVERSKTGVSFYRLFEFMEFISNKFFPQMTDIAEPVITIHVIQFLVARFVLFLPARAENSLRNPVRNNKIRNSP